MGFAADRIPEENLGHKMLIKIGFRGDHGLGKNESGIKEPLLYTARQERLGLGRDTEDRREMAKKVEWRKMLVQTLASDVRRAKQKLGTLEGKAVPTGDYEAFDEDDNYIGRINEWAQRNSITCCDTLPNFRMIHMGDAQDQIGFEFECSLTVEGDRLRCTAKARTKKVAKKRAAFECLKEITKRGFRSDYGEIKLELLRVITELRNRHHYCLWCETKFPSQQELLQECRQSLNQSCEPNAKYLNDTKKAAQQVSVL